MTEGPAVSSNYIPSVFSHISILTIVLLHVFPIFESCLALICR